MFETVSKLTFHAKGVWRFRWHMMLVTWFVCLAGWMVVHFIPDQYKASARIYIDTESMLQPLLQGIAVAKNQQAQEITRRLLSRPNMEAIARDTDLDLRAKDSVEMEKLLEELSRKIQVTNRGSEFLYTLSYEDSDPAVAKRVVQAIVNKFVEGNLGENRKDNDIAQRFLEQQIGEYEAKLTADEQRLADYKRENVGLIPAEGGRDYYQRFQEAMGNLEEAKLQYAEAAQRRDVLREQITQVPQKISLADSNALRDLSGGASPVAMSLDMRIVQLRSQLSDMQARFTDQHPDVLIAKNALADLEERKRQEGSVSKPVEAQAPVPMGSNPAYQQIKLVLAEAEATVSSLRARVNQYAIQVNELREKASVIPKMEAELSKLSRDYQVNKEKYEILLSKRDSAKISEQAAQSSDEVKFKIVDPPFVPQVPSGPNRLLFMSVVLLAGMVAGIGFAIFMSQLQPVFFTGRDLRQALAVPLLGSVAMCRSPSAQRNHRIALTGFAAASAVLLLVYGTLIAAQSSFAVGAMLKSLVGGAA